MKEATEYGRKLKILKVYEIKKAIGRKRARVLVLDKNHKFFAYISCNDDNKWFWEINGQLEFIHKDSYPNSIISCDICNTEFDNLSQGKLRSGMEICGKCEKVSQTGSL